jgi:hypothetical protein
MKKAFEQNVSRAKPRVRLGALTGLLESPEAPAESEPVAQAPAAPAAPDLSSEVRARIERSRAPRPTASEAVSAALRAPLSQHEEQAMAAVHTEVFGEPVVEARAPRVTAVEPEPVAPAALSGAPVGAPAAVVAAAPVAHGDAPSTEVEIQTPSAPAEELDPDTRRERLKERLKAVRENPRPEPLPATVAEAGMRAVERINGLQAELTRIKALNLTLTQELEAARRQSEKATEEARLRMDEARRLAAEVESRVKLLGDLESELTALEGERDEALLSLQEARQAMHAAAEERAELEQELERGKKALADSLAEEERLATELESAQEETASLRRAVETLQGERDVLAQQVASLTAERAELLEARKALEAVHRALSHASAR